MHVQSLRARSRGILRDNTLVTVAELAIVVLIAIGGLAGLVPVSTTPFLLLFGWLMLWLRGSGWRDVGLVRPAHWWRTLLLGAVIGVAFQHVSLYAVEPLIARLTGELPDVSLFAPLVGNAQLLLLSLAVEAT